MSFGYNMLEISNIKIEKIQNYVKNKIPLKMSRSRSKSQGKLKINLNWMEMKAQTYEIW
jgi:hypothetical protein